jgi:uncharacterized Rmd1/YagE family protein
MRCTSYCTAGSYKLAAIADFFKAEQYSTQLYRNVLHLTKKNQQWHVFLFANGCLVTWGLRKLQEQQLLTQIKVFSVDPLEEIETDRFIYKIADATKIRPHQRLNADVITIDAEETDNVQLKLAISYGLAQSVKLQSYESSIEKTVNNNQHISVELAKTGKISLSRKLISRRIGEIFLERSSVNLTGEYFDVPEYFWQYSNLENYYIMTEQFLDIPKRVAALNHKLNVLHELFDMLNNQLQHRHSSMLEIVIILLIFIEIVLNVFHVQFYLTL